MSSTASKSTSATAAGPAAPPDAVAAARAAGLRYVSDARPGITRRRAGKGFAYYGADGKVLRDAKEIERIKKLAIPPAWTDVWICPLAHGHLQATGRDARGRKQYRYHPQWREIRDETKFERMIAFGEALPKIRARIEEHLSLPGMPREKVLAAVVKLLETTLIRIGNDEYKRHNESFGLTTIHGEHVDVEGAKVQFRFRGKSGQEHEISIRDRRVARIVRRCQDLPGEELFEYVGDDGETHDVGSGDVNDYLREVSGEDFTAKDFRTWGGTVLALATLSELGRHESATEAKKNVVEAVKRVAAQLGNRPAICRKYYIHPGILDAYTTGELADAAQELLEPPAEMECAGLSPFELRALSLLRERQKAAA